MDITPSMLTSTGLLSSSPGGTSKKLVVGLMSIVHGPSLVGFVATVSRFPGATVTLVGTLGQVLLPNVTTYMRPGSAQSAEASKFGFAVVFGGSPVVVVTEGSGAEACDVGAEPAAAGVATPELELVVQPDSATATITVARIPAAGRLIGVRARRQHRTIRSPNRGRCAVGEWRRVARSQR